MRAGEAAWCALAAGVLAWEIAIDEDDLLSAAVDRATKRHPILVRAAIITTAAHFLRIVPARFDPFTRTFSLTAKLRARPSRGCTD
ncbi:DUF7427 family protein [Nocardia asiatica]